MKKYWSDLCIAVSVIVLAIAVLNLASKQQKQYNDMAQRLDEVASHTDALDTVMVDINYKLNDIQDVQKENQEENQKTFNKLWNSIHKNKEELQEEIKRVEESKAEKKIQQQTLSSPVTTVASASYDYPTTGLTKTGGVNINEGGHRETYYNLDMSKVVNNAKDRGLEGEYWVRDDGAKMFGDYVIVAADQSKYPYGSTVDTSMGEGIVIDTGSFIYTDSEQYDIATDW